MRFFDAHQCTHRPLSPCKVGAAGWAAGGRQDGGGDGLAAGVAVGAPLLLTAGHAASKRSKPPPGLTLAAVPADASCWQVAASAAGCLAAERAARRLVRRAVPPARPLPVPGSGAGRHWGLRANDSAGPPAAHALSFADRHTCTRPPFPLCLARGWAGCGARHILPGAAPHTLMSVDSAQTQLPQRLLFRPAPATSICAAKIRRGWAVPSRLPPRAAGLRWLPDRRQSWRCPRHPCPLQAPLAPNKQAHRRRRSATRRSLLLLCPHLTRTPLPAPAFPHNSLRSAVAACVEIGHGSCRCHPRPAARPVGCSVGCSPRK